VVVEEVYELSWEDGSWLRCGRIVAANERILERILVVMGLQRCWS
jgi:hypothetical protein